jgi:hypothetical protein
MILCIDINKLLLYKDISYKKLAVMIIEADKFWDLQKEFIE